MAGWGQWRASCTLAARGKARARAPGFTPPPHIASQCAKCTKKGGCSKCSDGGYITTGANGLPECASCRAEFGYSCIACDAKAGCTSEKQGSFINKTASGIGMAEDWCGEARECEGGGRGLLRALQAWHAVPARLLTRLLAGGT